MTNQRPPKRAIELNIAIHADDLVTLRTTLQGLIREIDALRSGDLPHRSSHGSLTGGYSMSFIARNMSQESYYKQLREWLKAGNTDPDFDQFVQEYAESLKPQGTPVDLSSIPVAGVYNPPPPKGPRKKVRMETAEDYLRHALDNNTAAAILRGEPEYLEKYTDYVKEYQKRVSAEREDYARGAMGNEAVDHILRDDPDYFKDTLPQVNKDAFLRD